MNFGYMYRFRTGSVRNGTKYFLGKVRILIDLGFVVVRAA